MTWYIDDPEIVIEITKIFNEAVYNGGENMVVPYEVFKSYIKEKGFKVIPNKIIAFPIEFPDSFEATIDLPKEDLYNIEVGKILENGNEQSKKEGLDFYPYLGKNLIMYCSSLDTEAEYNQDIIVQWMKII